jgi:hypothetical protein
MPANTINDLLRWHVVAVQYVSIRHTERSHSSMIIRLVAQAGIAALNRPGMSGDLLV